ncbi:MAG: magnesium transporter [Oscillospiraceae bacterium]
MPKNDSDKPQDDMVLPTLNTDNFIEESMDDKVDLIDVIIADDNEIDEQEYDLKKTLLDSNADELTDVIESVYAIDVALALEEFNDEEMLSFYKKIDDEHMAQVLEQADEDTQVRFIGLIDFKSLLTIFHHMSNDDIADILGNLPINMRKDIFKSMKSKDTIEIQNLLLYEDDTAGGLMTTEYIALNNKLTIANALKKIKEIGPKTEVIETIFVLNDRKELVGTADLRDILVERDDCLLEDIMCDNIISVTPEVDQEEVSHLVSKYDLKAIAVTNRKNSLLGIITVDDIIDVLFEEQTEDILRMGGVSAEAGTDSTLKESVKMRLPWLIVNLATAFLASFTVSLFEGTIAQVTALAAAMPIVAGMGGNSGTQTLSIVMRNITLGEISLKDDWKLVLKEVLLGIINGAVIGLFAGMILYFKYENIYLGVIIFIAMICNLVISGFFGFFIPLILKSMGIDPALASGIFLTTATDVGGFFVFLGLASLLLPLLI